MRSPLSVRQRVFYDMELCESVAVLKEEKRKGRLGVELPQFMKGALTRWATQPVCGGIINSNMTP